MVRFYYYYYCYYSISIIISIMTTIIIITIRGTYFNALKTALFFKTGMLSSGEFRLKCLF